MSREVSASTCALCGHPENFRACGSGNVTDRPLGGTAQPEVLYLCHTDSHSCYHRWTVYGERPNPQEEG